MNPKIAHRGEQKGSFLKNLNSYSFFEKIFATYLYYREFYLGWSRKSRCVPCSTRHASCDQRSYGLITDCNLRIISNASAPETDPIGSNSPVVISLVSIMPRVVQTITAL